jgi:nitrile hydratase
MSPAWYKQSEYRARSVREPRKVLQEFGVELPESTAIHVWDSTAELRYIVIPQRPAGTDGWTKEQLASIVTRNSMIGTDRDLKLGNE